MYITKQHLKKIIKEELEKLLEYTPEGAHDPNPKEKSIERTKSAPWSRYADYLRILRKRRGLRAPVSKTTRINPWPHSKMSPEQKKEAAIAAMVAQKEWDFLQTLPGLKTKAPDPTATPEEKEIIMQLAKDN
jgi:hypothetical protein